MLAFFFSVDKYLIITIVLEHTLGGTDLTFKITCLVNSVVDPSHITMLIFGIFHSSHNTYSLSKDIFDIK